MSPMRRRRWCQGRQQRLGQGQGQGLLQGQEGYQGSHPGLHIYSRWFLYVWCIFVYSVYLCLPYKIAAPFSFSADFQRVCESQLEVEKSSRQRGWLDRPPSQHVDVLAEVITITVTIIVIIITITITIIFTRPKPPSTGSKA